MMYIKINDVYLGQLDQFRSAQARRAPPEKSFLLNSYRGRGKMFSSDIYEAEIYGALILDRRPSRVAVAFRPRNDPGS